MPAPAAASAAAPGPWSSEPPECRIKLRGHPENAGLPWSGSPADYKIETFNPSVEHGGGGQGIRVFAVGLHRRSELGLFNKSNPFALQANAPGYAYGAASPYNSGRGASASGTGGQEYKVMSSYLNGATIVQAGAWQKERPSNINFPGKYIVAWLPKWKSAAGSVSGVWSGADLVSTTCTYRDNPRADPNEGPQPRPPNNTLVNSLSLNVWVFAEPPSCTVGNFLFEVNEPIVPKVTLSNPNNAPMWVDVADSNFSRATFSRTDVSGYAGQAVPANGDLVIEPTVPSIDHSGEFVLNWTIQTNMGNETWTTLGTPRPPQRSWFEDPEERIVDSSANACEVTISKVVYLPFIKVFYGGLVAGGQFGTSPSYSACGQGFEDALGGDRTVAAFVAGHTEGSGFSDARGSSVEYALQANNIIGGFYSASQRASPPIPLKGLTLSNNDVFHAYGGSFGRKTCITNYWREVEKLELSTKPSPLTLDLKTELDANERRRYKLLAGEKLELSASGALDGLKATLYVEGDVLISENIIQNGGPWYNPSEIGYLSIIVKGNIDIDPDVTEINALLVAYPKLNSANDVVDGRIRTCWYTGIDASVTHFHTCDKQLVINGALIAEKILFGRVYASVKQEVIPISPPPSGTELFNTADRTRLGQIAVNYYTDVSSSLALRDEIGYLLERGILKVDDDCSSTTGQQFCPASSGRISRGRTAIWLARALNGGADPAVPPVGTPNPFTDVNNTQAWWPHVFYLANHPSVGPAVLGYKGGTAYSSSPTLFSPNNNANRAWTAVLLAAAFEAPATTSTFYTTSSMSSYDSEIQEAINAITEAEITNGWQACVRNNSNPCTYGATGQRKTHIAALLARAFVWDERGQTFFPTSKARNTKAAEVINLLPEYFIGVPELPLFGDQLYKTDSVSTQPVNF